MAHNFLKYFCVICFIVGTLILSVSCEPDTPSPDSVDASVSDADSSDPPPEEQSPDPDESETKATDPPSHKAETPPSIDTTEKSKVCQFKEDHLLPSGLQFFGSFIFIEGSKEPQEPMKIIVEKWWSSPWDDFDEVSAKLNDAHAFIVTYQYTGYKYDEWCVSNEEICTVKVIYSGNINWNVSSWHGFFPKINYVYTGNLLAQIYFPLKILDFSGCHSTL